MLLQRFDQPLFSEFFPCSIKRFCNAVGIECKRVSREELASLDQAIPCFKESQYCACGTQPFKIVITSEEKSG